MDPIYLDNNSTTLICPAAIVAIEECWKAGYVNPASQHRPGQQARQKLEQVRESLVGLVGGQPAGMSADRLIFTSGGTESNNLALRGLCGNPPGRILISAIEHPSVIGAADFLRETGFEVGTIPVAADGVVAVDELAAALETPTRLVSIMLANNETGVIQPVQQIAGICHAAGALMHTDAVQAVGKIPVSFAGSGVDAMTWTAHKCHGPRGIGALLLRSGLEIQPILRGGFQQMASRPGTEDVALAAGMDAALCWLMDNLEQNQRRMRELRDSLWSQIESGCGKTVCNGSLANSVPHTLNVSFRGLNRQAFLMAADMAGLAVSTGSACASGSSDPSHVIAAMSDDPEVIEGSIRISLSVMTSGSQINEAARRIIKIANELRRQN